MNKKLVLFFVVASFLSKTYPLSDAAVRNSVIISGAIAGLGGGFIAAYNVKTGNDTANSFISATTGIASGAAAGFLIYWYLNKYHTPRGRYEMSLKYLNRIQNNYLLSDELTNEKDLIAHINSVWTNRWPLISAKNRLSDIKENLLYVVDNLGKVINELKKKNNKEKADKELMNNCITLIALLPDLIKMVQDRISIIIADKDYNFQMNLFHQYEEHEKQMQHEAWQGSLNRWEKSKDRWSRERIAKEKMNHQTNLVNGFADVLTSNNNPTAQSNYGQTQSGMYPSFDDINYNQYSNPPAYNPNYDSNYDPYDYGYVPQNSKPLW
ncbi:MAG: YrzE family protein [bacterium]